MDRTGWRLPTPWLQGILILVVLVWWVVFADGPAFWTKMAGATFTLGALGVALGPPMTRWIRIREVGWGIVSAAALYLVFFLGREVVELFGAGEGVQAVYGLREGTGRLWIALLFIFPIGPGEELFWRGLIQPALQARWGRIGGLLGAAGIYGLVHWITGNPILVLAALVCGLFWGILVEWRGCLTAAIVSHVLWDLTIFLVLPLA